MTALTTLAGEPHGPLSSERNLLIAAHSHPEGGPLRHEVIFQVEQAEQEDGDTVARRLQSVRHDLFDRCLIGKLVAGSAISGPVAARSCNDLLSSWLHDSQERELCLTGFDGTGPGAFGIGDFRLPISRRRVWMNRKSRIGNRK